MKKVLLGLSILFTTVYLFFRYSHIFGLCDIENYQCRLITNDYMYIVQFAPFMLAVSAIALLLPEKMFMVWWQFAKWGGPIAIALIMLINAGFHHTPGGFMNMDAAFDQVLSFIVYTVFTLGSLIQIYRGYRGDRKNFAK